MDELIGIIKARAAGTKRIRDRHPKDSREWLTYDAMLYAYMDDVNLLREAKRRMADRDPAWNLQP